MRAYAFTLLALCMTVFLTAVRVVEFEAALRADAPYGSATVAPTGPAPASAQPAAGAPAAPSLRSEPSPDEPSAEAADGQRSAQPPRHDREA